MNSEHDEPSDHQAEPDVDGMSDGLEHDVGNKARARQRDMNRRCLTVIVILAMAVGGLTYATFFRASPRASSIATNARLAEENAAMNETLEQYKQTAIEQAATIDRLVQDYDQSAIDQTETIDRLSQELNNQVSECDPLSCRRLADMMSIGSIRVSNDATTLNTGLWSPAIRLDDEGNRVDERTVRELIIPLLEYRFSGLCPWYDPLASVPQRSVPCQAIRDEQEPDVDGIAPAVRGWFLTGESELVSISGYSGRVVPFTLCFQQIATSRALNEYAASRVCAVNSLQPNDPVELRPMQAVDQDEMLRIALEPREGGLATLRLLDHNNRLCLAVSNSGVLIASICSGDETFTVSGASIPWYATAWPESLRPD